MISKNFTALMACLGLLTVLTGCEGEQSEKDMIMEAQYCLDKSTASTAQSCVSSLASLSAPNAYALRCAANFIAADVTSSANLASAITAIQDDAAGTTTFLAALSFSNGVNADETATLCEKSGSPGLALFGAMAKSATALSGLVGASCSGDPDPLGCAADELDTTMNDIIADFADYDPNDLSTVDAQNLEALENVASSVQTVYSVTCGGNSNANSDICGPINSALTAAGITDIANANLVDLGLELLTKWKQ